MARHVAAGDLSASPLMPSIQASTGPHGLPPAPLPPAPWQGLGVLAAWAAGALLLGGMLFVVRDA